MTRKSYAHLDAAEKALNALFTPPETDTPPEGWDELYNFTDCVIANAEGLYASCQRRRCRTGRMCTYKLGNRPCEAQFPADRERLSHAMMEYGRSAIFLERVVAAARERTAATAREFIVATEEFDED